MPNLFRGLLLAGSTTILLAAPAATLAAPVTVDLRIEGKTATLFEGPVTTDVRPFRFTTGADTSDHTCDGTAATGGTSPTPIPTRGAAVMAATDLGLTTEGSFGSFGASFTFINGSPVGYDAGTGTYLVEYENFKAADLGACSDDIVAGDQVLFGVASYGTTALKLTGPATVAPGATATVKVVDGASSTAMPGAAVGGQTTAADGTATVGPFASRGPQALKAEKAGTVRSNRLTICVTDGADGFCGTTKPGDPAPAPAPPPEPVTPCITTGNDGLCGTLDVRAPGGSIRSVSEQQRFARGKGPRMLAGEATDAQGIRKVRLRLTRTDRGRCASFDGVRERFVRLKRCGASRGTWFEAGTSGSWSYLLPARLTRGRYVLDVEATDRNGNVDRKLERGRNRVVFHVS